MMQFNLQQHQGSQNQAIIDGRWMDDDSSNEIQEIGIGPGAPNAPPRGPPAGGPADSPPLAPPLLGQGQGHGIGRGPPSSDDGHDADEESDAVDVIGEEPPKAAAAHAAGGGGDSVKNVVFKNTWFDQSGNGKKEEPAGEPEPVEVKLLVGPGPKRAIVAVQKELLANIPYFRALLKEQSGPEYEINLPQLTKDAVNRILDYQSSGEMLIPESIPKIHDLMKAAVQIRMDQLLQKCIQLLKKMLSLDNCLELRQIAAESSYTFANEIDDFIRTNFHRLYTRPEFLEMGVEGFEELVGIYTKHGGGFRAALIYKAIVAWVRADEKKRGGQLSRLMKLVNLTSVLADAEGLKREDFDLLEKECPTLCLEAYKENYWASQGKGGGGAKGKGAAAPAVSAAARKRQASGASTDSAAKRAKKEPSEPKESAPASAPARGATRSGRATTRAPPAAPTRASTRQTSKSRTPAAATAPLAAEKTKAEEKPAAEAPAATGRRGGGRRR